MRTLNAIEDENLCLICHLPLKEPVQTRCGHRFCKKNASSNILEGSTSSYNLSVLFKHLNGFR